MKNDNGTLFFISNGNRASLRMKEWLDKYKIKHKEIKAKDLTRDNIQYIIDTICLDLPNGEVVKASDIISISGKTPKSVLKRLEDNGVNPDKIRNSEINRAIRICPEILRTPITLKDGIALVGGEKNIDDFLQFLEGEDRDNPLWLGADLSLNTEQKIEWIISQFAMPETASIGLTKLYFPKTSILYGGNIKWTYSSEFADEDGFLFKEGLMNVKMEIILDDVYRSKNYIIEVNSHNSKQ